MNEANYQTNYGEGYSQMSLTEKLRAESNAEEMTAEEKTFSAEIATSEKMSGEKAAQPKAENSNSAKAEEKPIDLDTAEKTLIKKLAKYNNKTAEITAQLVEVQKLKWNKDMESIGKICSRNGIVLSDLKTFLGYVRNNDTLKMYISEISVRSKTMKKKNPPDTDKSEVNSE